MIKKENFDESQYLKKYPDIADAVSKKVVGSGYEHYRNFGHKEKRQLFRKNNQEESILVSIVVPNFNKERFISHTIESVLVQNYTNLELIIVDDVSTDGSVGIIKSYQKEDPRVRLIQHRANSGGCAAPRNTGILAARGEVICFLDSDDFLFNGTLKTRIESYKSAAQNNPNVIGVYSGTVTAAYNESHVPYVEPLKNQKIIDFMAQAGDCPFNANQPMLKTEELKKFGGFDENFTQAEDWHLWNRILRHGYIFVPTGFNGVAYRESPESMVRENALQHMSNSAAILSSNYEDLPEEEIVSGTPYVYRKPWWEYKRQMMLVQRFFSFSALSQSTEPMGALVEEVLPDLEGLANGVKIVESISAGYRRKMSAKFLPEDIYRRTMGKDLFKLHQNIYAPSEASSLPTPEVGQNSYLNPRNLDEVDVVFFPHSAYHVLELSYVYEELKQDGIRGIFINSSIPYRDQGVLEEIKRLELPHLNYTNFRLFTSFKPKAAVCLCDWDLVVKPVIAEYKSQGVPTIGIVEGVQDYDDVDTGRPRNAYREVEHLFIPGDFDRKYFADHPHLYVAGISRIDKLWHEETEKSQEFDVLINVNFTYGVLEDKRDEWIRDVVDSCERLGYTYTISQHHADMADLSSYNVSEEPLYSLLRKSDVFVTRFSTTVMESLALKTPVVYYNPKIEKIDKFVDPVGAYEYVSDSEQLQGALEKAKHGWSEVEEPVKKFLAQHCNLNGKGSTKTIIAKKIKELIEG